MEHNFGPYPLTERGGGKCPPKKFFFVIFFCIFFRKEDGWFANAKKIFLILPPPWGGVKVEKFRFLGFTKYPKVLQHCVIAR